MPGLNEDGSPSDAPTGVHPLASLLAWFARGLSGVRIRWLGCDPGSRQRVYFANHTSHLDAAVIWAALPPPARALARPVAGRDYWDKTRLRRYLASRVFRAVLIDRHRRPEVAPETSARAVIEAMVEAMGERNSLIVFPEGTRGSGDDLAPFKSGLYYLALAMPAAELVPAYLENLNRILPKGAVMPVPLVSSLTFGPPLCLGPGESKQDFLVRAREAVRRLRSA